MLAYNRAAMEKDTSDLILQLFGALTNWSQDHWEKLWAFEKMLDSHPEMWNEYQQKLNLVRQSGAAQTNRQSVEAALNNLRSKLLRE